MSDVGRRVHTLLTDGAIAGLTEAEREELELLLAGQPIDSSYEHAAAAIDLSLLGRTDELPNALEATIIHQAGRYFGFTAVRPREPTLGVDADATPVRRVWERSPENIDEFAVLESSLTNGRIDGISDEILISTDDVSGEHPEADPHEAERAQRFESEVDAQLDALEQPDPNAPRRARADQLEDDDELEDDEFGDDDELEDDEHAAPPRSRKRSPSKRARPSAPGRANQLARVASYVSALAALAILVIALWLLFSRGDGRVDPDALAKQLAARDDTIEWRFVPKPDKLVSDTAGGSVRWNSELQSGLLILRGLAANDPSAEQYQLWIVDRKREGPPVDGGVFNVKAGVDELRIPVDAKLLIGEPDVFVITVERPGGVVVSRQDRVVLVATR